MADATPYFGIAPFVLGMSRDVVRGAAGKPDSVETSHDDEGGAVETWFYQGGEIELEFEAVPDSKLESITAWSPDITVNGVAIIGCDLDALPRLAAEADIRDLELTDDFGDSGKWLPERAARPDAVGRQGQDRQPDHLPALRRQRRGAAVAGMTA